MEYSTRNHTSQTRFRTLSPMARVYRRNNYAPINKNINEVKGILQKFMLNKTGGDLEKESKLNCKQSKSVERMKQNRVKKNEFAKVFWKTGIKIRKSGSKPVQRNELAITASKLTFAKTMKKLRRNKIKEFEGNSNYTSYSSIYKCLVEKIPLVC